MKHQVNPRRIRAAAPAAPDGGYAWFILLSCFLVFGLTFGVIKSFGVFYVEIHQYFETSATGTSWITSIAVATIHVVAPAASALSTRFSHRSVVVVGGLMCSLGVMLGSFSRSVVDLYLTVGLLNGFGYALTWTPTVTMVGMYFEKRRPLANALSSAGECIFTFVLTPLFQLLIHSYSWRGALLVLGALQLHLCVCGMLLRPLATRREHETEGGRSHPEVLSKDAPAEESVGMSEASDKEDMRKPADVTDPTDDDDDDDDDNDDDDDDDGGTTGTELKSKVLRYVDYTLITNPRFMVYSMFGVFAALGFFAPALFLVPYARSRGIAEYEAAALVSISAAMDLFGRVFFGWLANLRLLQTVLQLAASVFVLATVMLLGPLCSTFAQLAVFSVAYGLAYGATVAIHITVLAEVVGVHRLGSALGFFMLLRSSGGLLGPPIAGFFIDKMSDYGMGFLMAGVALIIAALLLLILNQMNSRSPSSS